MADYLIDTDFRAKDLVNPTLKGMEKGVSRFSRHAEKSLSGVFKGSFLGNMAANTVTAGLMQIRRGIQSVVTEYSDFDQSINEAAVKFGNIDYGSAKFQELGDTAREVGRTTKFTTADAAQGLQSLAGAGFEVEASLKLLPSVANFAAAAKMDLATATQTAGQALNAFAMSSKDAVVQSENLVKISDMLAETDRRTMADMYGLGETVSWAAGRFTAAGQSIETFGAIAGGLADVAVEGSAAGTVMRNMIKNLTAIGPKGKKALKQIGLGMDDIRDKNGDMTNLVDLLGKMEAPIKKLGTHTRSKVLGDIFGERAVRGVIPLLNKGIAGVKQLEIELKSASGASKEMGDQLNESLTFRIMAMQNAMMEKGFQVFEEFLGTSHAGIEDMIKAINDLDVKPIANFFKGVSGVVQFLAKNIGVITRVGLVFGGIKAAMSLKSAVLWGGEMRKTMLAMSASGMFGSPTAGKWGLPGGPVAGTPIGGGGGGRGVGPMFGPMTRAQEKKMVSMHPNSVSINNAANVVMGVGIAASIGYSIGNALDEYLFKPMRDEANASREKTSNILAMHEDLMKQRLKEGELLGIRADAKKQLGQSKADFLSFDTVVDMFASTFGGDMENPIAKFMGEQLQLGNMFSESGRQIEQMNAADKLAQQQQSDFTDQFRMDEFSKEKQDQYIESIGVYTDKQNQLNELYATFADNIAKASKAAEGFMAGGNAQVNVHVDGPGAGSVTTKSETKGNNAPKVNVSQAGPN